ncbi:MAG: hypothetical protein ACRDK7_04255 [Solirubrobacteraceae bacterium]
MSAAATLHSPKTKTKKPRRTRTPRSGQAQRTVLQLLVFYRSLSQLASALGVTRDTARSWSAGTAPARPRVELLERAELLLSLCGAARRYMADDHQVGTWTLAPSPALHGHSPAEMLARHGREGLQVLLAELATVAPPRPGGPVEMPFVELLRESLATGVGAAALKRIEKIAAAEPIELGDAELDAQLRGAAQQNE